jgi:carbohydrate-selective porin OprB
LKLNHWVIGQLSYFNKSIVNEKMKQLLSNRRSHGAVHHDDFDRVRDDCDVEIARAQPDDSPDQPVPQRDPMKVLESIHHEGVESKYQCAGNERERRETLGQPGSP